MDNVHAIRSRNDSMIRHLLTAPRDEVRRPEGTWEGGREGGCNERETSVKAAGHRLLAQYSVRR